MVLSALPIFGSLLPMTVSLAFFIKYPEQRIFTPYKCVCGGGGKVWAISEMHSCLSPESSGLEA